MSKLFLLAGSLALVVLSGCSGGDLEQRPSSVAEALDLPAGFAPTDIVNLVERREVRLNEVASECMRRLGFEYFVVADASSGFGIGEPKTPDGQPMENFASEFGWGITPDFTEPGEAHTAEDPNDEYREGLSPAAYEAYETALYGTWATDEDVLTTGGGCNGEALREVRSEFPVIGEDEYRTVLDLQRRFEADFRVLAFNAGWSSCMSSLGHEYRSPSAAGQEFRDRARKLFDPSLTAPVDVEELLAILRQDETAMATSSIECGLAPPGYPEPPLFASVRAGLEETFLRDNPDFGTGDD